MWLVPVEVAALASNGEKGWEEGVVPGAKVQVDLGVALHILLKLVAEHQLRQLVEEIPLRLSTSLGPTPKNRSRTLGLGWLVLAIGIRQVQPGWELVVPGFGCAPESPLLTDSGAGP